ncbi:MAG: transglutaminase domain-containing protein [Dehalococcoidia bacterium]
MFGRIFRRYFLLIFVLWILFVLYPNPLKLIVSFHRILYFDGNCGAVEPILDDFPSDPPDIERAVLARLPYRYDWELYGMPWYCPTIEEVLERQEGDCKARALVLASVLKAKNIPYRIHSSLIHIWVEYENKRETSLENPEVQFYRYDPETGDRQFQMPKIGLGKLMSSWRQQFWTPMPTDRRPLLVSGSLALVVARLVLRHKRFNY